MKKLITIHQPSIKCAGDWTVYYENHYVYVQMPAGTAFRMWVFGEWHAWLVFWMITTKTERSACQFAKKWTNRWRAWDYYSQSIIWPIMY